MDGSRYADLNRLQAVLDDPNETYLHKKQAYRTKERILQKLRDPVLKKQRQRLILAHRADDVAEVEKISELLQEYEARTYGR
jgi:hypothetical protein